MSELREEYFAPFTDGDFRFSGGTLFSTDESKYACLVSRSGCTFFCTNELANQIRTHSVSNALKDKLIHMGFFEGYARYDVKTCGKCLPTFFAIDFTTKCNMKCSYCLRNFEDQGNNISVDQLTHILEYLCDYYYDNRLNSICIQAWGGEPLLALDEIIYMRKYLDERNVNASISIQTNGLLLNDDTILKLENNHIEVGVSLDGCEDVQDIQRRDIIGNSTFLRVVQNVEKYNYITGKKVGTISVISKQSIPYLEQSVEALVKTAHIDRLKFNFMHSNSVFEGESTMVTHEDIKLFWQQVMNLLIRLYHEGYEVCEYNISDKIQNLLTGGGGDICHSCGCTGGYNFVSFSQDGQIYPCEMIGVDEYRLGDIYEGIQLSELIKKNIQAGNQYFMKKQAAECDKCPWVYFCGGGCTAAAHFNGKKAGEIDDMECASNKVIYRDIIQYILDDLGNVSILTAGKYDLE